VRYSEIIGENKSDNSLPGEPGTEPIPQNAVRLYHQTTEDNLNSIMNSGLNIEKARGIEGPRAIYASETGFYGKPGTRPTVEFYVDKDKWDDPFVLQDVPPDQIIAGHLPWHSKARYILEHPDTLRKTLAGEFDDLSGDYIRAVEYIKSHYKR
jgi:hypothetical protein